MDKSSIIYNKISVEELPQLLGIMKNAEHMRYSVDLSTDEKCKRYVEVLSSQWSSLGYGCWSLIEKSTGLLIGWGGIIIDEDDPRWGPELIFYIAPDKCGLGYASELTNHALSYAIENIGLRKIVAFAHPDNIPSNRVLVKAGFKHKRFLEAMNRNYFEYCVIT